MSSAEGGVLSRAQLASVFSDVGFGPVPSDRMFDLFDKDGNGTVSYLSLCPMAVLSDIPSIGKHTVSADGVVSDACERPIFNICFRLDSSYLSRATM